MHVRRQGEDMGKGSVPGGRAGLRIRSFLRVAVDVGLLFVALALAFLLRFDWAVPAERVEQYWLIAPAVAALTYALLIVMGATRHSWRYTSLRDVTAVGIAAYCAAAVLGVVRAVGPWGSLPTPLAYALTLPFGVIAINFGTTIMILAGARVLRRSLDEARSTRRRGSTGPRLRTVLVGAGDAGVLVLREARRRPDIGIDPVAFVDDDPAKRNRIIHSLRVMDDLDGLGGVIARTGAEQVLITIAQPPGELVRSLAETCESLGVQVRTVPGLYEIVDGRANLTQLRPVQIEDLLRRDPVTEGSDLVQAIVKDATVMVTGAGGSIGSELCRQLMREQPATLILVERAEHALYSIHRELSEGPQESEVDLIPAATDVTDVGGMRQLMVTLHPDVVFHAAAHKHVPMMESQPVQAAKNNVLGTIAVVDACVDAGIPRFVMISTDKAVNPTSVMGATKRVAERYVQHAAHRTGQKYVAVRFGNVLGSNGSVVPVFQQQIEAGGPVTVTHPEMERYFMTIPEACKLVMEAGAMAEGGEILVLDMGDPVKIVDLARDLIRLSGLRPDDIAIEFIGMRPGEKLFEELGLASEAVDRTHHPRINQWATATRSGHELLAELDLLRQAISAHDDVRVRSLLRALVPEFEARALP